MGACKEPPLVHISSVGWKGVFLAQGLFTTSINFYCRGAEGGGENCGVSRTSKTFL